LQHALRRLIENDGPDDVAVAANDCVRTTELMSLVRIQRGVYAAEHNVRTSRARTLPDLVTAERVAGVNADPDSVTGAYAVHIKRFKGLVDDLWPAIHGGRRACQHEQPTRRDDSNAERQVARVNEMDSHAVGFSRSACGPWPRCLPARDTRDGRPRWKRHDGEGAS
jgi:hypothetical protein